MSPVAVSTNGHANGDTNGSSGTAPFVKPSTRLRQLLSMEGVCHQAPGVYDGICARVAIEQGFPIMYQSGSMTTASRLGLSDLAFASLNDFAMNGMMIANLDPRVPLIADADTGFGAPPAIARMVQMYDRCNIAGFHIEDQVINKRCGHLKGKQLVDMETWKARIRACKIGRDSIPGGSDIVIIARTDAKAPMGYEEALNRANVAFLEAIETAEEIQNAVKVLAPMHLLVNFVSNGKTPWYPPATLAQWGLAIYPGAASKTAYHAITSSYKYLKETGMDEVEALGLKPVDFFNSMGLQKEIEIDRLAGGDAFAEDA